ncbi:MAG: phosphopantetheine-binding protein [Porticoccaceae bacterium]
MNALELTKNLLRRCLQLSPDEPLSPNTELLGGFPEFNSLTITTLIVEIEEALDCEIADHELTSDLFQTVATLADFVDTKMAHA